MIGFGLRALGCARVVPLDAEHAERLAEIHAEAFAKPWDSLAFERLLAERGVVADGLMLTRTGPLAGFVLSRCVVDEAEILTFAILRAARGRGYAGPLLRAHCEALAARGVARVHLEVAEGNAAAMALYRRQGFREVGRRAAYYTTADGSRLAAITMVADL